MKKFVFVVMVLVGLVAWSQTAVIANQGQPGKQGPWSVIDGQCQAPVETALVFDGGAATPCPPTALAGRRTILLCNSPKNTGTPVWTIRTDGLPTTAITSPGQVLGIGDCITYTIPGTNPVDGGAQINCISDTGNSVLLITECK